MKILDLGCGKNKYPGSFGVDFSNEKGVDMVWNLNEQLPKKFYNKFDIVNHCCVLDHIGNPWNFLEGCVKYLKNGGKLRIIIDNGDYWRYHVHLGNYHASVWEIDDPDRPITHHKMLFQMKHITKMLTLLGLKVSKTKYFRDYESHSQIKALKVGHIDYLLPKHLGTNMMFIEAIKS